jgi:adenylosuccinate lyase
MMAVVKNGGNRQAMHEVLREHAMNAYQIMQDTDENPLEENLLHDEKILAFVPSKELKQLLDPKTHIGLAKQTCITFLQKLQNEK